MSSVLSEDGLFLPFTPAGAQTERQAIAVKARLNLMPYDSVNPNEALKELPAILLDPKLFLDADPALGNSLFVRNSDGWSAIGFGKSPASGQELILLNPAHHRHRQRATLMEEIVHITLDHPKVELVYNSVSGSWSRRFDKAMEDVAYNVGAACLLPYQGLFKSVNTQKKSAAIIASEFDVSQAYVEFRIRRCGLYRVYRKRQAQTLSGVGISARSRTAGR